MLWDGRPFLGRSKTWRGLAAAVLLAACAALVMGLSWRLGALAAASAMAGDCFSSFVKRRFRLEPKARGAGVATVKIQFIAYGWLGLMAGIGGLMQVNLAQEVVPNALIGRELDVLAAAVLGGARRRRVWRGHGRGHRLFWRASDPRFARDDDLSERARGISHPRQRYFGLSGFPGRNRPRRHPRHSVPMLVFAVAAILWHVLLARTRHGFAVAMIGSNPRASEYSGIPVGVRSLWSTPFRESCARWRAS